MFRDIHFPSRLYSTLLYSTLLYSTLLYFTLLYFTFTCILRTAATQLDDTGVSVQFLLLLLQSQKQQEDLNLLFIEECYWALFCMT
jgi:hypothetical protein